MQYIIGKKYKLSYVYYKTLKYTILIINFSVMV